MFLARGYGKATVEAIAEDAGFSTGVVYSQFGSKAVLFLALLERRIDERAERNEPVLRTHDRYGKRIDEVELDPSWHWCLRQAIEREIKLELVLADGDAEGLPLARVRDGLVEAPAHEAGRDRPDVGAGLVEGLHRDLEAVPWLRETSSNIAAKRSP